MKDVITLAVALLATPVLLSILLFAFVWPQTLPTLKDGEYWS